MFKSDQSIQDSITIILKKSSIFRCFYGECQFFRLICRLFKKTNPTNMEFLKSLGKALLLSRKKALNLITENLSHKIFFL